jgi:arsenate reductase
MSAAVTIFHNPSCSTSRKVLAQIRDRGLEPRIVDYLKAPPSKDELANLAAAVGGVRALLRTKEALYRELGLDDPQRSDDELLDALAAHPVLLNRPVVVTDRGARVCRPPETVIELLA